MRGASDSARFNIQRGEHKMTRTSGVVNGLNKKHVDKTNVGARKNDAASIHGRASTYDSVTCTTTTTAGAAVLRVENEARRDNLLCDSPASPTAARGRRRYYSLHVYSYTRLVRRRFFSSFYDPSSIRALLNEKMKTDIQKP